MICLCCQPQPLNKEKNISAAPSQGDPVSIYQRNPRQMGSWPLQLAESATVGVLRGLTHQNGPLHSGETLSNVHLTGAAAMRNAGR